VQLYSFTYKFGRVEEYDPKSILKSGATSDLTFGDL